jgi:2-C-methyl-D-erythritol 2,4-cyclodiphosphate synthase
MAQRSTFRSGIGYDVHRLVTGRPLVLLGVTIPHDRGLAGHSDADVACHALIDALLGAAGLGDIGQWFPDTDARYAGADSMQLLTTVVAEIRQRGYTVCNCDLSIVAQRPKLAPFATDMRERAAACLGVAPELVNVKAKTTEGLGFCGREEGIAAYATALLKRGGAG